MRTQEHTHGEKQRDKQIGEQIDAEGGSTQRTDHSRQLPSATEAANEAEHAETADDGGQKADAVKEEIARAGGCHKGMICDGGAEQNAYSGQQYADDSRRLFEGMRVQEIAKEQITHE